MWSVLYRGIKFFQICSIYYKGCDNMGYTALYRKFRPITFSELVGQEHITRTLRNQIIADRVGHAYLFNGGRGTGKSRPRRPGPAPRTRPCARGQPGAGCR